MKTELLKICEISKILRTSKGYIRNQIYLGKEGDTIPHSIKLGNRRLWFEHELYAWLEAKSSAARKIRASKI